MNNGYRVTIRQQWTEPMAPRKKSPFPKKDKSELIQALEFVTLVNKDIGTPLETHVRLANRTATAFNGILAAGAIIAEDIVACPHAGKFLAALRRCQGDLSITQSLEQTLCVAAGRFRAIIPFLDPVDLQTVTPDPAIAVVDERLRTAMIGAGSLATDAGQTVLLSSVLLRAGSCIGTDRAVMVEYWHGIDLPNDLVVPKSFVSILAKVKKQLVGFGYSKTSITLYFDDNSWLRTQLYSEAWPNIDPILNVESAPELIAPTFFEALDAVAEFSENGHVHFIDGKLCSHYDTIKGATYSVEGLPNNFTFSAAKLKAIQPFVTMIDFQERISLFFGENVRGAIVWITREN